MVEQKTIEKLLSDVTHIRNKYDEIAKITGENFNVFKIMKTETKEVHPHSSLISELLDERGSHGQDNLFLNLFIEIVNKRLQNNYGKLDRIKEFDKSTSCIEYNTGAIDINYTKGGRIDILVEDKNQLLIIENKIGAEDQRNQILRYHNYAVTKGKTFIILYLWKNYIEFNYIKFDNEINKDLIKEVEKKVISISYKNEIIEWIEKCIEATSSIPNINQLLKHYLETVKTISNQIPNSIKNMNIQELLLDSQENFNSAESIATVIGQIKNITEKCQYELIEKWSKKYGNNVELFEYNGYNFYVKPSFEGFYFHFDLYPLKNKTLGCADHEELKIFRDLAQKFEGRNKDDFWNNYNYTTWLKLRSDLKHLTFEDYKKLNIDRTEWLDNAMNEGLSFIKHMVKGLIEMKIPAIKVSEQILSSIK